MRICADGGWEEMVRNRASEDKGCRAGTMSTSISFSESYNVDSLAATADTVSAFGRSFFFASRCYSLSAWAMLPIGPRSVGQHRPNVGFGDGNTVHDGVAVKPPHGLAAPDAAHVIFDGIAGHHRLAEFAFVDGEKIDRARLLCAFDRHDTDHPRGLRHGLDHHHTGIDRPLGKMTEKRRLVDRHVLDPDAAVVAPDIDDPVDQQHRIAMRKRLEDGVGVHNLKSDPCLPQSRPSPFGSAVPSRTRRSSATISRNHCLVGFAKKPPQRPLAGMSSLTALIAVT